MAVYDARPSAFTQLSSTSDWEAFVSAIGGYSDIDFTVGSALVPSLDVPGRNIVIADGNIVIKGMLWRCDAPVSTPIPAASAQNRIDRLVLRLTRGAATSATVITPTIITGTPSGSPVEPPVVQTTTGIWDFPICSWTSTSAGGLTTLIDERAQGPYGPSLIPGPCAVKSTITSRANNIVMTDDPDLKLMLAGNSIYEIRFSLFMAYASASNIGFSFAFTVPTGATGEYNKWYWSGAATNSAIVDQWTTIRVPYVDNTRDWAVSGHGTLFTTSPGFFTLQWCQGVTSATNLNLVKNSLVCAEKIG